MATRQGAGCLAYLDVSASTHIFGDGGTIADELRETIKSELGLTVSVGVSFNKVFAKLGSDMKKPDGTTVISEDDYKRIIWPLPASDLLFVGRATAKKLFDHGITTIGGIAQTDPEMLRRWFGINGVRLWQFANGYDKARVCNYGYTPPAKSVGHGITFNADLVDNNEVYCAFLELAQDVSEKLRTTNAAATAISIFVRNNQLYWQQYQMRLPDATQNWRDLADAAYALFREKYNWQKPIRSLTVTATRLVSADAPRQCDLFYDYAAHEKQERIECAVSDIRRRFGKNAINLACLKNNAKFPGARTENFLLPNIMYQ